MTVVHITYATPNFRDSVSELAESAARFGIQTTILGPNSPAVRVFSKQHPEIMRQRRGAGYWLWKPFIVHDALISAADGDVVLYTDAGVRFVADPLPLLGLSDQHSIVHFRHTSPPDDPDRYVMRRWTKRDAFVLLDADEPRYWNAPSLTAGFLLYRANSESRAFVRQWLDACCDPRILTDRPNVRGLPDLPGFVDHRHDQAALTILSMQHNVVSYPDPSQFGIRTAESPFGQIFHLHRRRIPPLHQRMRMTLKLGTRARAVIGWLRGSR